MPFDENKICGNCLFRLTKADQLDRCRFNAPQVKIIRVTEAESEWTRNNKTIYPPCPGPACGQWQSDFEEPTIEPEEELPGRIDKDD